MFLLYLFDRLKKTKYLLILPEIVIADNFLYSLPVLPSYQLGCSDGFRSLPLYVMMKWRAEDSSNPVQFLLPWCSRVSEYCYPGTESVLLAEPPGKNKQKTGWKMQPSHLMTRKLQYMYFFGGSDTLYVSVG